MKRSFRFLSLLVGLAAACGGAPQKADTYKLATPVLEHPRAFDFGRQGHWRRLDNGLIAFVLPDPRSNLVTVDVRYRVGAAEDPADKAGLAHLVEHLTYETGGADEPTLTGRLATAALFHNAYTTADSTHYTATGHRRDLVELLTIESARLRRGCRGISEVVFERERDVVASEIRQRDRGPLSRDLARAIYGADHPYSRPVGGTLDSLERITRDDVCEFLAKHYGPSRAIVVVAGNVDENRVDDLVAEAFAPIPARPLAPRTPLDVPRGAGKKVVIETEVDKPTAFVAFAAPVFSDPASVYSAYLRDELEAKVAKMVEDDDALTDSTLVQFGGRRVPMNVVVLEARDQDALSAAVEKVYDLSASMGLEIDRTDVRLQVPNRITRLLLRSEPVARRARWYADYAQFSRHPGFVAQAMDVELGTTSGKVRARAPRFFRQRDSLTVIALPSEDSKDSENPDDKVRETADGERAIAAIDDVDYDIPEWSIPVDPKEVHRPLEVPRLAARVDAETFTLENGLEVVMVSDLTYPLFDARLVMPVGRLDEPADRPYLASLAAWLLSASSDFGDPKGKDYRKLAVALMELVGMGGIDRVSVRQRTTTFQVRGLARYADGLLWRLYLQSFTGHYEPRVIERFNEVIQEEDDEDEDDEERQRDLEEERRGRLLRRAIYGADHPYAAGSAEPGPVTVQELEAFRDAHYTASGARLIVVGRFDPGVVRQQVERLFGEMRPGKARTQQSVPAVDKRKAPVHLLMPTSDDQISLTLAFAAAPGNRKPAAARLVLGEVLRMRLSKARERLGSTYGINVDGSYDERGPGMLMIGGYIDLDRARKTVGVVLDELASVRKGGEDLGLDFARARRRVLSRLLISDADSDSVADGYERALRDGVSDDRQARLLRDVATLRLEDLEALIAAELAADQQVMVVSGPWADLEKLYKALGITDATVLE